MVVSLIGYGGIVTQHLGRVKASREVRRQSRGSVARAQAGLTILRAEGISAPMLIYKIFRAEEWAALRSDGQTAGAPIDLSDGYIHFSTAAQAAETAAKHFAGQQNLFLIAVDADRLGADLKWEPSRGGALFPHLYREMRIADVHWARPLPLVDGAHVFPEGAGF